MFHVDVREARLKILENDLLLIRHEAQKLKLESVEFHLDLAIKAITSDPPQPIHSAK